MRTCTTDEARTALRLLCWCRVVYGGWGSLGPPCHLLTLACIRHANAPMLNYLNIAGHWDPKITTPPGLYLFAAAYSQLVGSTKAVLAVLGLVTTPSDVAEGSCAAELLRQVNWAFSLGTLVVMRALLSRRMVRERASNAQ